MKRIFVFILFSIISITIFSFEINKISEFSFSEVYEESHPSLFIRDNNLFVLNHRSFQIFDISNNDFQIISELNLEGELRTLSINGDYAYIATLSNISRLYRIDISELSLPTITDTINYLGNYSHFVDGQNVFIHELLPEGGWIIHVYENETFQEILEFPVPCNLWTMKYVGNGIGVVKDYTTLNLYDILNIYEIELINSNPINDVMANYKVRIIQDSILIVNSMDNISIYNISEQNQWELLSYIPGFVSGYEVSNNQLVAYHENQIWLYAINEPGNPILLDQHSSNQYIDFVNNIQFDINRLILTTLQGKLIYFTTSNYTLQQLDTFFHSGCMVDGYIYQNNLYIATYLKGITHFDLENLQSPQFINHTHDSYTWLRMTGDANIIIPWGVDTSIDMFKNVVFDISDNGQINEITCLNALGEYALNLFYYENCGYFLVYNSILYKYTLDLNNNLVEVAQVVLPVDFLAGNVFFYGDIAYIQYIDKLAIIADINSNNIHLSNTIITPMISIPQFHFFQEYLFLSDISWGFSCYLFNINDPLTPDLELSIENSGVIGIDNQNELLFLGSDQCEIYDLANIENGIITQLTSFRNWSNCREIIPFSRINDNFFLYLENTSASIYQYYYEPNSVEDDILLIKPFLSNNPNPFNPETKIVFTLPEAGNVKLEIYNIKGQKVKTLLDCYMNPGRSEIIWNGKDDNGKLIGSGVYFYKLHTPSKSYVRKCMLLK